MATYRYVDRSIRPCTEESVSTGEKRLSMDARLSSERLLHLTEKGKNRKYPDENPSCYQNLSLDSLIHEFNVVYAKGTALA